MCLENRNFRFGRTTLDNDDAAIEQSRYTIGVFTPAYLASNAEAFQSQMAQALAVDTDTPRMIPVMRKTCTPPLHVRTLSAVDCRRESEVAMMLELLACALHEPLAPQSKPPPSPPSASA